ncbi:hypothetical protein LAV77_28060 [Priestia megaterium]|uniref:type IV toxin-antitoxin system AbiEi family antitoxin domain-containing protein n=1 Tax=Priestia megaterium TaxID=1404 RepID=UPI002B24E642|nr:hypothetical protein [Priestia megaterium]MEB2268627.1 hypothetical protein [Priestia megaterium]
MARPNRYQIMELYKDDIISTFASQNKSIFTENDLKDILYEHQNEWRLPYSTEFPDLFHFLLRKNEMSYVDIEFPKRVFTRYLFRKSPDELHPFDIALSLVNNSYLSHYTAAFVHNLTDNIVKTIYVNKELSPKLPVLGNELTQEKIDKAFSKEMRTSKNIATFKNRKICLLESKNMDGQGIIKINNITLTSVERTLIDIAVRPNYSGGVYEVLRIFMNAQGEASINKLYSLLKKFKFVYPYHQVIGFYLERAGYKESAIKLMERFPMEHKFYLTYAMKNMSYSERWKLYYPIELDSWLHKDSIS